MPTARTLRFFEFGNVYNFSKEKHNPEMPMAAYKEECHLGLWVTGKRVKGSWAHPDEDSSFYELKAYVDNILRRIGLNSGTVVMHGSDNNIFSKGIAIENRAC